jgi:multidrug efflux pump subunit AcrA (membrane-fusion protein)
MRRVVIWLVGAACLAAAVALIVVTTAPAGTSTGGGGGRLAKTLSGSVAASSPTVQALTVPVEVSGVVGEDTAVTITPQIPGSISQLDIQAGQHVTAGQAVARLTDTQGLAAKQAQAKAALAQAQAALDTATAPPPEPQAVAQAQTQVDAARSALQSAQSTQQADAAAARAASQLPPTPSRSAPSSRRSPVGPSTQQRSQPPSQQQLAADAQAVATARRQLQSAQRALSTAQHPPGASSTQVSAAQSAVNAAQSGVDAASAAMNQLTVTAPVGGTVAEVLQRAGDYATPGQPIAQLAGDAGVVTAQVPPMIALQLIGHIGATASVRLAVPAPPPAVTAHLGFVAPAADLMTQQTTVTLSVPAGTLTPGQPVTATIRVPLGRQTTVPSNAISYVDGVAGVYALTGVLDPSRLGISPPAAVPAGSRIASATFTPVTVLATVGGRSAIRGALPTGAQIVTTGQTSISTGQRVAVLATGPAR